MTEENLGKSFYRCGNFQVRSLVLLLCLNLHIVCKKKKVELDVLFKMQRYGHKECEFFEWANDEEVGTERLFIQGFKLQRLLGLHVSISPHRSCRCKCLM